MRNHSQAGWTLIEVVMAISLLALFTVLFYQIILNNLALNNSSNRLAQVGNYAQLTVEYLQASSTDLKPLLGTRGISDYQVLANLIEPGWLARYCLKTEIRPVKDSHGRHIAELYQVDVRINCLEAAQQEVYALSTIIYRPGRER